MFLFEEFRGPLCGLIHLCGLYNFNTDLCGIRKRRVFPDRSPHHGMLMIPTPLCVQFIKLPRHLEGRDVETEQSNRHGINF